MKFKFKIILTSLAFILFTNCSIDATIANPNQTSQAKSFKYLALGDSYTIGQSVCETCKFPIQLQDSIKKSYSVILLFLQK